VSQAAYHHAQQVKKQNILDVAIRAGGHILADLLGINDIKNCFHGSIGGCVQMVLDVVPWSKILKIGKIIKDVYRAYKAVRRFLKAEKKADTIIARFDSGVRAVRSQPIVGDKVKEPHVISAESESTVSEVAVKGVYSIKSSVDKVVKRMPGAVDPNKTVSSVGHQSPPEHVGSPTLHASPADLVGTLVFAGVAIRRGVGRAATRWRR
jgi:hypothetical protein